MQLAPSVQVTLSAYGTQLIDFDFDLRQLMTQVSLDALCEFVCVVGKVADPDVVLTPEGHDANPFCVCRCAEVQFDMLPRPRSPFQLGPTRVPRERCLQLFGCSRRSSAAHLIPSAFFLVFSGGAAWGSHALSVTKGDSP